MTSSRPVSPSFTSPATAPAASPGQPPAAPADPVRPSSRLLLWLPVPGIVLVAHLLIQGDLAQSEGVVDLDPLYGLTELFVAAIAAAIGLVAVVVALVGTWAPPASRASAVVGNAIWTAVAGGALVAFMVVGSLTDATLRLSSTDGAQVVWQVGAALAALAPLVLVRVLRSLSSPRR